MSGLARREVPQRKSMEHWIRDALTDPDKLDEKGERRNCTMIALVHMTGMQERELHSRKFGGTGSQSETDLAELFHGKARAYSQDLPGVHTFQLQAFYNGNIPEAFFPFLVNALADGREGLSTENPTEQGRTQQMMRQGEMLFQQAYRKQQHLDDYALRIIEVQGRQLHEARAEASDSFNIVKDMLMQKVLEDHGHKMELERFKRSTEERKKWMSFAPALANTVMGREIFPQSAADTALIEAIAEGLPAEAAPALAQFIKPELLGPLMARLAAYQEKKNAEAEQHSRVLKIVPRGNPEDDAAGGE